MKVSTVCSAESKWCCMTFVVFPSFAFVCCFLSSIYRLISIHHYHRWNKIHIFWNVFMLLVTIFFLFRSLWIWCGLLFYLSSMVVWDKHCPHHHDRSFRGPTWGNSLFFAFKTDLFLNIFFTFNTTEQNFRKRNSNEDQFNQNITPSPESLSSITSESSLKTK